VSDASEHVASPTSNAADIEARAVAWVNRRHFWDWTEENQVELDAWLAESLAHRVSYWRMNSGFDGIGKLTALRRPTPEKAAVRRDRNFLRTLLTGGAAATVFVIGTSLFFLTQGKLTYSTPVGGHKIVALSDGSQVELNTDTILRMKVSASGERMVWLDKGEAYFQIKHDATHPFVVSVAGHRVTDLGTKFLIRDGVDRLEVMLTEGRARFESTNANTQRHSALLTPGDVAVATASSMSVIKRPVLELTNELEWRHGVLVFKHTTLADAAAELNRYNEQKIVVVDPAVARLTIDGTFPANGVPLFVRSAQEVFELHVENRGSETVISR
jgi:transmembrane sensor